MYGQSQRVLEIIKNVNNYWQEENPEPTFAFWHPAAYHTGNIAAYEVTGNIDYKKYSEAWAEKNQWKGATSNDKSKWKYNYGKRWNMFFSEIGRFVFRLI